MSVVEETVAEEFDKVRRGIKYPRDRKAQCRENSKVRLPNDMVVVSADSHWSLTEDIFYKRFPDHLKHKAPRLVPDASGVTNWFVDGRPLIPEVAFEGFATFERVPGSSQIEPRLRDLDLEGVNKEIVFGNAIGSGLGDPDTESREHIFRIYNEHLAEMQAKAPGRFHGVGLINYWDMSKVRASIMQLKSMGLKTYMLPQHPKGAGSVALDYCDPSMEPLWAAAAEADLPLCFHTGEFFKGGPGGWGTSMMIQFGPFRKNLAELIFGGIFDRYPNLQVVFAEADINWIPGAVQHASMAYTCFNPMLTPAIKHNPRYYWQHNCYATFMHDPVGLRMLDQIGADRVMWSHDYPHPESVYGFGWDAMQSVIDATTEEQARMILGGTAMKVFKLD